MPNTGSFEIYLQDIADPRGGAESKAFGAGAGSVMDDEMTLLRTAGLCRLPMYCPDDGLDACGVGFQIQRFVGESNASYRARLVGAFTAWKLGGSALAIITQLQAYGFGDVFILPVWQSPGPFAPESSLTQFDAFYVFLGPNFGTTGVTTSLSTAQIAAVKGVILKWKDAQSLPIKIVLQTSGTAGQPTTGGGTTYQLGVCFGEPESVFGACNFGGFILP